MTRKVFTKLLGLFVLLLAFHTAVLEVVFRHMAEKTVGGTPHMLGREAIYSGLIALVVALPIAAWAAVSIMGRLQRVVDFARRIAAESPSGVSTMNSSRDIACGRLWVTSCEEETRRRLPCKALFPSE